MADFLDQIIQGLLKEVRDRVLLQGERALKIEGLKAAIAGVRALRMALFLNLALHALAFLWAVSLFAVSFLILDTWSSQSAIDFGILLRPTSILSLVTFIGSSIAIFFLVRDRTWTRALGLQRLLDDAVAGHERFSREQSRQRTQAELEAVIAKVLDEKLEKLTATRTPSTNPRETA